LSILVVGSVALDSICTPYGTREEVLGGAATYFATAASLYDQVNLVAVVGTDFPPEHIDFLRKREIDLRGLQVVEGRTFRWVGRYDLDLNTAITLDTQLNVFADFHPHLPESYRTSDYVFLANIDPDLQLEVLEQVHRPKLVALDTMNYWIDHKKPSLAEAISKVDVVLINEAEARQYTGTMSLIRAAQEILTLGPKALVVKRGEYGCSLFTTGDDLVSSYFSVPAYPLKEVTDPTGAGDSFAAGFMGYLAQQGRLEPAVMRQAVIHGSVVASFTVEDFGIGRLRNLSMDEIEARCQDYRKITFFDVLCPWAESCERLQKQRRKG